MEEHRRRWQEAVDAGLRVGRVHVSWAELEPHPERYDLSELTERLTALQRDGLAAFVLVETIDSEGYSLPPDLMDPHDESKLAEGRLLNHPVILARFQKLLDLVVPELVSRGGWLLSVGNEPDNVFDDLEADSAEGKTYWKSIVEFTKSARLHVHKLNPQLAVTITLTQAGLVKRHCDFKPVIEVVDVAAFNYYYQDHDMNVKQEGQVQADVAQMIAAASGRSIVLQEVGCPAGYSGSRSIAGGNEESQAKFLAALTSELNKQDKFRAAFWFTMVDWSPEMAAGFVEPLRDQGFAGLADKYEETMRTWGLIKFTDGTPRPAWKILIRQISSATNRK